MLNLGLNPLKFDEKTIEKDMLFVKKFKNNVRDEIFDAKLNGNRIKKKFICVIEARMGSKVLRKIFKKT